MKPTYLDQAEALLGKKVNLVCVNGNYSLQDSSNRVAYFCLAEFPGCCGMAVSFCASVNSSYRNKGLGRLLNLLRQQIAYDNRFTVMVCTDVVTNEPQQKILTGNGWEKILEFKNRKTNNQVAMHKIDLKDTGTRTGFIKISGCAFSKTM